MSPKAAERFAANAKSYAFHASTAELTDALAKRYQSVAELKARGGQMGGSFNNKTGELNLDGDVGSFEGKTLQAAGAYAHEFGHALDGMAGDRISEKPEWTEAWAAELQYPTGERGNRKFALSAYAASTRVEGFAEFSRLVHATKLTAEQIKAAFPRCAAVWEKEGLL